MSDYLKNDVREQLTKGQLLVIVGSGISIGATNNAQVASWGGLLRNGIQRAADVSGLDSDWKERRLIELEAGLDGDLDDLLGVAEKVTRKLDGPSGGEYGRWLRESVGSLSVQRPEALQAIARLGAPIATTNYDSLLSKVTGLPAICWTDTAKVEQFLRGDLAAILHLHGHFQRPDTVILGIRDYESITGSGTTQQLLRSFFLTRSALFIGCGEGLDDPNFGALLRWHKANFHSSHYRHFRLEKGAADHVPPPNGRLHTVSYGPSHDDLPSFLAALTGDKSSLTESEDTACNPGATEFLDEVETSLLKLFGSTPGTRVKRNPLVRSNARPKGRRVDFLVEVGCGPFTLRIVVDCRWHDAAIDIEQAEGFLGLLADVRASKGILVTSVGATDGAAKLLASGASDTDLILLSLPELKVYHGLSALPFSSGCGVCLVAPSGWLLDARSKVTREPIKIGQGPNGLAFLHRRSVTREYAINHDCFIYCMISQDQTMVDLLKLHESTHPPGAVNYEYRPLRELVEETVWEGKVREGSLQGANTVEITAFVDFGDFIFWAVLLAPEDNDALRAWAMKGLTELIKFSKPVLVPLSYGLDESSFDKVIPMQLPAQSTSEKGLKFSVVRIVTSLGDFWRQEPRTRRTHSVAPLGLAQHNFAMVGGESYADPVFDLTVKSEKEKNCIISAVGIEILTVAQDFIGYGPGAEGKIPLQEQLCVEMPDLLKDLEVRRTLEPQSVNTVLTVPIEDPYLLRPGEAFRFSLQLRSYKEKTPNFSMIRFLIETDEGQFFSEDVHIFTM